MGKASRMKQSRYAGVDGQGRPLFPDEKAAGATFSGVPVSWILAVLTGALWLSTHLVSDYAPVTGVAYVVAAVLLGLLNPGLGAMFAVALVPFYGSGGVVGQGLGVVPQGLAELGRSAPILGAAARLLFDRFAQRGSGAAPWTPSRLMVGAAVAAMVLYPITRLTANGATWAPETRLIDETLFLFGAPVAMYAAWVVFSHLPRSAIERTMRLLPAFAAAALVVAVGAWAGLSLLDPFAFKGIVYGRLAALGYPTPTAMGIAITLPLAVGALWTRSRQGAAALLLFGAVVIFLTQSRGPLLALFVGAGAVALIGRQIPKRYIFAGVAASVTLFAILLLVRYPDLLQKLSHLRLPKLYGDELRVISWVAAFQIALANPLTGGGWMSVRGWNDGELGGKGVNLSHNVVLQGLADGGVVLGAAIATVVLGSLRNAWGRRHKIPISWIGAAVVVVVCGLWDMPQLRAYAAVMGGLALGLVSRRDSEASDGVTE